MFSAGGKFIMGEGLLVLKYIINNCFLFLLKLSEKLIVILSGFDSENEFGGGYGEIV